MNRFFSTRLSVPGKSFLFSSTAKFTSIFLLLVIAGCNSNYTPKPKGYYKIEFPAKQYQLFDQPGYPYSFEYPTYSNIIKDTSFFGEATENPWWINIDFPQFNGKVHISYKSIGQNRYDKLVNDAYTMTNKHTTKANSINDSLMETPNGIHGIYFNVGGNVATANQFFLTDTTRHFLRGALYFDATPNEDSLRIVNQFLQEDLKHLINTFKWK
jgi:gliding motility-associated lipoprotein GldD